MPSVLVLCRSQKANTPGFSSLTRPSGNSNAGHEYAAGITPMIKRNKDGEIETFLFPEITKQQRKALVEYVKSL